MRTPDQLIADLAADRSPQSILPVLWEIIDDIQSSYRLALDDLLPSDTVDAVEATVSDYLANHYGDD